MTVNQNFAAFVDAREAVKSHPMCGRLEDDGAFFIVVYPAGDFPTDGARARYTGSGGKKLALENLLRVMEREWLASFPGSR